MYGRTLFQAQRLRGGDTRRAKTTHKYLTTFHSQGREGKWQKGKTMKRFPNFPSNLTIRFRRV